MSFRDIEQIFLHRQFNLENVNDVTIDGCRHYRWSQMATHAIVNFTLVSPGGVEYCTCFNLINFFFRTGFCVK